ncbi:delta-lactam-biosynthetic de-N-acetylase [Romboutsia sp.]|uniref:delta-lactam-biosynthetic de-N-acetylase n=1 Tax=Romboutsia sp. TaxID=1965302 RepID=UPI003F2EE5C4
MKKLTCLLTVLSLCFSLSGCSIASTNISMGINKERFKIQLADFDNTCINWFFIPNTQARTPKINDKLNFELNDYNAIYNGPTNSNKKSLYLTFDEGYENGYTERILDVLKEKNVKAIFFVTSHYICYSPDTVKRMVAEGHVVANHTKHHYSMPSVTYSAVAFNKELYDVEDRFKKLTGQDMPKFFRPPMGKYSEKSLAMTKDLGYKTVFWSFAYGDYEPNSQPGVGYAKNHIFSHLHDGSILLLHAISKTNASILGEVIDEARKDGYEFYLLP